MRTILKQRHRNAKRSHFAQSFLSGRVIFPGEHHDLAGTFTDSFKH